ncbi:MAG: ribbon-helix-helix domain-containing protein [Nanoarchaeota archaeon]
MVLLGSIENISLKLEGNFLNAIVKVMKKHNYTTKTEFIREAMRDKIRMLEEKEIVENKEVFNQIVESERNIKKGKIKEFKY